MQEQRVTDYKSSLQNRKGSNQNRGVRLDLNPNGIKQWHLNDKDQNGEEKAENKQYSAPKDSMYIYKRFNLWSYISALFFYILVSIKKIKFIRFFCF